MAVCRKKDDASCKEKNMNVGSTCGQWRCSGKEVVSLKRSLKPYPDPKYKGWRGTTMYTVYVQKYTDVSYLFSSTRLNLSLYMNQSKYNYYSPGPHPITLNGQSSNEIMPFAVLGFPA